MKQLVETNHEPHETKKNEIKKKKARKRYKLHTNMKLEFSANKSHFVWDLHWTSWTLDFWFDNI